MKKLLALLLTAILCLSLVACASSDTDRDDEDEEEVETENPVDVAKEELKKAYDTCCEGSKYTYANMASDGMSLTIDTNPYDSEYSNSYEDDAIAAVLAINSYLKFPSSLNERISSTRALDGMQTQTYGQFTVTWTYHPDNGLKVIYEINR